MRVIKLFTLACQVVTIVLLAYTACNMRRVHMQLTTPHGKAHPPR